ncbi:substrate-binding periplasmic protein [Undibacterium sp. Di27W]|uniref:substrate-binding periplasmic protein n=1 Tax=Undibacterium sp. Di27W TaxID=3413036 RepID=UPI003BF237AD
MFSWLHAVTLASVLWSLNASSATLYLTEAPPYSYIKNGLSQGINVRIAEEISLRSGIPLTIVIVPSSRHINLFNQDKDGYSIALVENFNDKDAPQLATVWQVPVALITKKEIILKSYEDIIPYVADKGLGVMRRLNYPHIGQDARIKRVEINTVANGLRMLQAERVAAIVATLPGILDAIEKQEPQLQLGTPLIIGQTSFVLRSRAEAQNNPTSKLLAKAIENMIQDGSIRRLSTWN